MSSALLSPPERAAVRDRVLIKAFLDSVPHLVYFKDRQSRFVVVSQSIVTNFGARSAADVIGRTDFDFFAREHAQRAFDDEQRILRTGEPIVGKLERESWPCGRVSWVLTSKLPLRNSAGEIVGTFGMSKDITQSREIEVALAKAQKDLVDASRMAGMAEVATGVLHNVGNVLNSLNVSASVLASGLRQSKAESLSKLAALLREHHANLGEFVAHDPKGKRVPEFLASLARHAVEERNRLLQEITSLQKNVDHIKEIVSMQQAYATMVGVVEPLDAASLMEDALRMNAGATSRHAIRIERRFAAVPAVLGEKSKVLQILINLIRNAKYACDEGGAPDKRVTLRVEAADGSRVRLIVQDNGVGIPAANLTRIFAHGFTTRAHGHGFGLHSAANAARELKGSLSVHSDGPGLGASFTLELPAALPAAATA